MRECIYYSKSNIILGMNQVSPRTVSGDQKSVIMTQNDIQILKNIIKIVRR
jgi:hypothetical protein